MNIDRTRLEELEFTMRNSGHIEQIVDESSFQLDIAPHHGQLLTKLRLNRGFLLQSSDTHKHGSKRRSQFVRETRQKLIFRMVSSLRIFSRRQQFRCNPPALDDFRLQFCIEAFQIMHLLSKLACEEVHAL